MIVEFVENIGAYRKFLPILKKYSKSNNIITFFDDDWVYPSMLIEKMYQTYLKFPNCFISMNCRQILYKKGYIRFKKKNLNSFRKPFYKPNIPRSDLWTNNGYGVMFSSELFIDNEVINYKKIKKICPIYDEIWINAILKKYKIKIVVVDSKNKKDDPIGIKWGIEKGRYKLINNNQNKSLSIDINYTNTDFYNRLKNLSEYFYLENK